MKGKIALGAVIFTLGFVSIPMVWSDNDFETESYRYMGSKMNVMSNPVYQAECGSCHMAYPPGLLSSASWSKIMTNLDDHFGENAELDSETLNTLNDFLMSNSADTDATNPPLRITETAYFKRKHRELPARMVTDNPKVGNFSQCNACHAQAEKGYFDEDNIRIPGYGRWDD